MTSMARLFAVLASTVALCASSVSAFNTGDHTETVEPAGGFYWGSVTANVDWCERNYVVTPYLAEMWNALSSLPITGFAIAGLWAGRTYARAEARFYFAFFWMMVVGLGSFAFHATLRRYAQAMDELPMLYASISLLYNVLDHTPPTTTATATAARRGSGTVMDAVMYRIGLKLTLIGSGIGLTTIYYFFPQYFEIFFLGYGSFLMSFVAIMAYHFFWGGRSARRNQGYEPVSASETGGMVNNDDLRPYTPVLGKLYYFALAGYFGGFVFWVIENTYCPFLPQWMQLHALWHIMAGLGTYCMISCQLAWRSEEMGGRVNIDNKIGYVLPIVFVKWEEPSWV